MFNLEIVFAFVSCKFEIQVVFEREFVDNLIGKGYKSDWKTYEKVQELFEKSIRIDGEKGIRGMKIVKGSARYLQLEMNLKRKEKDILKDKMYKIKRKNFDHSQFLKEI